MPADATPDTNCNASLSRWAGAAAGLIAMIWCGFGPVLQNDFIGYDDPSYVTENPFVTGGLTGPGIKWAFTAMHSSNWHPLTWLSHMLDCQWFGLNPAAHHAMNLFWHTANTLLVLGLLNQLTKKFWPSAFIAAVFAIHPMHVESVAWVAERKDVLATFFGLLTLMAYARYTKASGQRPEAIGRGEGREAGGGKGWYALALGLFACGLMSKPMLVTWPFLMLLLDFWPLGRFTTSEGKKWVAVGLEKIPFLILVIASCWITVLAQARDGSVAPTGDISLPQRILNAGLGYAWYAWKFVWPVDLAIIYPLFPHRAVGTTVGAVVFLVTATALGLRQAKTKPYLVTGWFWFLGTLVPVIGLVQVGMQSYANRYSYFPYLGLSLAVIWGLGERGNNSRLGRRILAGAAGAALLASLALTRQQVKLWKNSATLFQEAVRVVPDNYVALNNLAQILTQQGQFDRAIDYSQQAIKAAPRFVEAWNNLGCAYLGQRDNERARAAFQAAAEFRPTDPHTWNNLGTTCHQSGDFTNAIAYYRKAVALDATYADAYYNLGNSLAALGQRAEAVSNYERAIEISPGMVNAHLNLGFERQRLGQAAAAASAFEAALKWKPDFANAHYGLATLAATQNDPGAETTHLRAFLKQQPQHPEARLRLVKALLAQGQAEAAVEEASAALRFHPTNAVAFYFRAVAHEQLGQAAEAITDYDRALQWQPDYPEALNNLAWQHAASADPKLRDGKKAVQLATRACELTQYQEALLIGTLAAAQAEAGQFPEAVATAERARDRATASGQPEIAQKNAELRELYRSGKSFHQNP